MYFFNVFRNSLGIDRRKGGGSVQQELSLKTALYQVRHKHRRTWKRVLWILSSVVVFVTTYALILPAITMEPAYICGMEAHVHREDCYRTPEVTAVSTLICRPDGLGLHEHTNDCYNENGEPECGIADFVLHSHDPACFDTNGELVCSLPEITAHTHGNACWHQPHVHSDTCYVLQRGELLCAIEEGSVHTHLDTCFGSQENLICTLPEITPHTHTEACFTETRDLLCTDAEVVPHTHSDGCYTEETTKICAEEEGENHTHTEACFQTVSVFSCVLEETAGHSHSDACYTEPVYSLICTTEETEGHTHSSACYETVRLVQCALEENLAHVHTDACFVCTSVLQCEELTAEEGAVPVLICEKEELFPHVHEAACFDSNGRCVCGLVQVSEHIHGDACFVITQEQATEPVLSCGLEAHEHDETCIAKEEADNTISGDALITQGYYCGVAEHSHAFESGCFTENDILMCSMTEHQHTWICQLAPSDPTAGEEPEGVDSPEFTDDPETGAAAETEAQEGEIDWNRIADVSNGPVISAYIAPAEDAIEEKVIMRSSTLFLSRAAGQTTRGIQDLQDYIKEQNANQTDTSKHASISFRLIDPDTKQSVPKNEDGTYSVVAGQSYIFSLDVLLPSGIHPGTYIYSLPEGVYAGGGSGRITTKNGVELGEYSVDTAGNITLTIYDTTDSQSQITILADVGIVFREEYESVTFDGEIKVVITRPPSTEPIEKTEVYKSAASDGEDGFVDGDEDGKVDLVHWSGSIEGSANSNIVGKTLTDIIRVSQDRHHYDEKSMSRGITFKFTDDNGAEHQWTVSADDPNLRWDRTGWQYGWQYTFPESITCSTCNTAIPLKNTYTYYFGYYSSINPNVLGENGKLLNETVFSNKIGIDDAEYEAWHSYTDGSFDIVKEGDFNSETVEFEWMVDVTIPGYKGSGTPMGYWCIDDGMDIVLDPHDPKSYDFDKNEKAHNAIDSGTVTASYIIDGQPVTESVPNISEADGSSRFAYKVVETETTTTNGTEVSYRHNIILLSRCECTEAFCANWGDGTCHGHTVEKGYCSCWTVSESVHFVFEYSHSNSEVIGEYGGSVLRNTAYLYRGELEWNGSFSHKWTDYSDVSVRIPGLLSKEKLDSNNDYIAKFEITVNEAMLDLSGHEKLEIVDTMSPTLDYIAGTLKIQTVDKAWQTGNLVEGKDFSVSYNAATHVMTITIHDPGEMEYILRYDTEINISNANGNYVYYNSAEIELFGISISSDADVTDITGLTATSKQYVVRLNKVDAADNTVVVAGATLALFDEDGNKIFEGVTDETGCLDFVTSVTAGALLYEHTLYYIQELAAPDGYKLDENKHWFYFCNGLIKGEEACKETGCIHNTIGAKYEAKKMPGDNINIQVVNEREQAYELPETGGMGTTVFYIVGSIMTAAAAVLLVAKKRMGTKG